MRILAGCYNLKREVAERVWQEFRGGRRRNFGKKYREETEREVKEGAPFGELQRRRIEEV